MTAEMSSFSRLFPTKSSFLIFVSYIGLFIAHGLAVTGSQQSDYTYSYNTVTVVLLIETTKLIACSCIYLHSDGLSKFITGIRSNTKVLGLYLVPAFLYCLYNNLAFVNLAAFDPTTYFLLLQLRVVITGIIFQLVFKKQLSGRQWISLLILTAGCIIKQLNTAEKTISPNVGTEDRFSKLFSLHMGLVLVQVFCSCFAGVYNEKLLKETGADIHIMIQNVFMYIDSILCNVIVLVVKGELFSAFTPEAMSKVLQVSVIMIILNNAAVGIITSLFLRQLNSILKTFASAVELMFTAVLSWVIFGIEIGWMTIIAIALVIYATLLYAQNPVVNRGRLDEVTSDPDMKKRVEESEKLLHTNGSPTNV